MILDANGDLLGTTAGGGIGWDPTNNDYGYGTVFKVQQGSGVITTLAPFNGSNGSNPGLLVEDGSGNLYGITQYEDPGTGEFDTAFELQHSSGTITTLATPYGVLVSLTVDSGGDVFGTTDTGGNYDTGYVFEIPSGTRTLTDLGHFIDGSTGSSPSGRLVLDSNGSLFGTTSGGGEFDGGTVFEVPAAGQLQSFGGRLADGTINQPGYSQTIGASGGTAPYTFSVTGTLPTGLTLSTDGVLSGTPTATGSYSFTVTATDAAGLSSSGSYHVLINPVPFSQYLVTVVGSSTVQAGSGFLVSVQEADASGNPVTTYNGPVSVTPTLWLDQGARAFPRLVPASSASIFPTPVSLDSGGQGFFVANLQKVGSYQLTVNSGAIWGIVDVTVTSGPAVQLAFLRQPQTTATGVKLPVVVQVEDQYGNVVTSDNADTITLAVASGPGSFTSGSTLTAAVHNGVAIFTNLTLTVPGSYTLSEITPGLYTGPNSMTFTVLPLQVVRRSLVSTTSGFSLQFNAPFLMNAMTPSLYGSNPAVPPTVTLTQITGTPPPGSSLPYQVPGSLLVNAATNTLTFVETDTTSILNNGTPLLAQGSYMVRLISSGASGLQAKSGGGYLDGTYSNTPGHDFTATFTIWRATTAEDVLWVPATAGGPGQALSAPGMNQVGGGYPVYFTAHAAYVTDVQATLTYDPSLLTLAPTSTATFTVTVPAAGIALLHYKGPALPAGLQQPLGFLTASVPAGTATNPIPYKAKDLLHLFNASINNGYRLDTCDGLHLVSYVGDADGNGSYTSSDSLLITRVNLQTDTGFAAYPLVDPVIVADTDGSGFIPADAALQVNEAGVGVPTTNLPIPPIPSGVHFAAVIHAHRRLQSPLLPSKRDTSSQPLAVEALAPSETIQVPVRTGAAPAATAGKGNDRATTPAGLEVPGNIFPPASAHKSPRSKRGMLPPSLTLRARILDPYFAQMGADTNSFGDDA